MIKYIDNYKGTAIKLSKFIDDVRKSSPLFVKCPEAFEMYSFLKNHENVKKLGVSSRKEAFWKCPVCGHEWKSPVCNFAKNADKCPNCVKRNHSIVAKPNIMKLWDWSRNKDLDPEELTAKSTTTAYWKCPDCGYKWKATVSSVTQRKGKCPQCSKNFECFLDAVPELKDSFVRLEDETKDVRLIGVSSRETALWKCPKCGREWKAMITSRIRRTDDGYEATECVCSSKLGSQKTKSSVNKYSVLEKYLPKGSDYENYDISDMITLYCHRHGNYQTTARTAVKHINSGEEPCPRCRKEKKLAETKKSLNIARPELAEEWSEKNEKYASEINISGKTEGIWKCHICGTEWTARIDNRANGFCGCPNCTKRLCRDKRDEEYYLKKYPILNAIRADKTPIDSNHMYGTRKWKCKKHGEYKLSLRSLLAFLKNNESPCPACRGINVKTKKIRSTEKEKEYDLISSKKKSSVQKTKKEKKTKEPVISFAEAFPEATREWSIRNPKSPSEYARYSKETVWWKCQVCGTEWQARIMDRARGYKACPECYPFGKKGGIQLKALRPDLEKYYSTENNRPFESLSSYDTYEAVWVCDNGHKFVTKVFNVAKKDKFICPKCTGRIAAEDNNFAFNHPEILKEWDYKKNIEIGLDPYRLLDGSMASAYWICKDCGRSYQLRLNRKVQYDNEGKTSCPYCANRTATEENNLTTTNPEAMNEWDYEANRADGLDPKKLLNNSSYNAHWKCETCGSKYDMSISERVRRENDDSPACPYCRGYLVNETNCLKATHPNLMKEWLPVENTLLGVSPNEIADNYIGKAWWQCPVCGYKYSMSVKAKCLKEKRSQNSCPRCNGRLQKRLHFF